MYEPDAPAWVSECIRRSGKEQPMMTEEEKKDSAMRLGKIIHAFFDAEPVSTNQEAIEVLGIATMYYHSFIYATGIDDYKEKP